MEIKEIKPLAMAVTNVIGEKTYFSLSGKRFWETPVQAKETFSYEKHGS